MSHLSNIEKKICSLEILLDKVKQLRLQGKRIVFTNGCFDILHLGHVQYLAKARDMGDVLIVGLNTDNSVSAIKGPSRPIQNNETRASILASLLFVDFVVFFDEETPLNLISAIVPNVLTKGADYSIDAIVGADIVRNNGGVVNTIDLTEGHSTTKIISKLLHN